MKIYILLLCCVSNSVLGSEIEEIVVHSPYQAYRATPVTYYDVDKELIDAQGILTEPSYLLAKTPSVSVQSDSGSYQGYSYFRIRGIDQTRINMTLDGIPLSEPEDQGVYFSNYPGLFDALQRVQVQRGVGLSQNGTASFGGSVQLTSADLWALPATSLKAAYGSYDTWSGTLENLSHFSEKGAVYLQASGVTSSGYKHDSGNQSYSLFNSTELRDDYGQWNVLAFTGEQDNNLAWFGVTRAALEKDRRSNANRNENDTFRQSLISIARYLRFSEAFSLDVRAYHNQLQGNYDFDMNNFLGIQESGDIYNYAFDSGFTGFFSTLHYSMDALAISAGFHINDYSRKHTGSEKKLGLLYQNTGYKDSEAFFIKTEYRIGSLLLFSDVERRKTNFDYRGSVDFSELDWSFYNPRAGASLIISNDLVAYYSLGRTGREPTRTDLFGGMDNLEVGDDGAPLLYPLKPEKVIDHEAGVRYSSNNINASINIFHMVFDHEITLNGNFGPNGLQLNQDVDNSFREGIEFSTEIAISPMVSWSSSASWIHSQINHEDEKFKPVLTPEWIAHTAIDWDTRIFGYGLEARYQSGAYINLSNTESVSSQFLLNAYLKYQWSRSTLTLYINNLLNRDYVASGAMNANGDATYFVGAPINFLAQLRMGF